MRRRLTDNEVLGRLAVLAVLCLTPAAVGGCYLGSAVEVGTGFRDSTVRKVSRTGLVWKTWEVEAVGDGFRVRGDRDRTTGEIETFTYSVSDPAVVEQLDAVRPNERVRLHYRRMLTAWQPNGSTRYFLTRVERVQP